MEVITNTKHERVIVKLNNPLMGTETSIHIGIVAFCVSHRKLNQIIP